MRCGTLTFPTYRLVPDAQVAPRRREHRRALGPPARPGRRGLRAGPEGAAALRLRGGHVPRVNLPSPAFRAASRGTAFWRVSALLTRSEPSRPLSIPSASSRSHSGRFCACAVWASAHSRSSASGCTRAPALRPQRRDPLLGRRRRSSPRAPTCARPSGPARSSRRPSRAYLRIRYGSAVSLNSERSNGHDADVGAARSAAPPPRRSGGRARSGSAPRRQAWKSSSWPDSSSCHSPISSSTSSGMPSATARSSAQSVRWPRWPSDTATTVAPRVGRREGVGGERDEQRRRRPSSRARSPSASETTMLTARAQADAARCSSSSRVALARGGVVGGLVAVPAPVPELGVGVLGDQPARERVLQRVEDHDHARHAGQPQPPRLRRREPVGDRRRQPQVGAVGAPARARRRRRPGALSRSSAWSRRMNDSSARGSSSTPIGGGSSWPTRAACSAMPPSEQARARPPSIAAGRVGHSRRAR